MARNVASAHYTSHEYVHGEKLVWHTYNNIHHHRRLLYFWLLFSGWFIALIVLILATVNLISRIVIIAYLPFAYFLFLVPRSFSTIFRTITTALVICPLIVGRTNGVRFGLPCQGPFTLHVPVLFLAT